VGAPDFHLLSLQLGDEPEMLERALAALVAVEPGETAFLPESLAWTPSGAGRAFARLIAFAQERNINIVTTLNLGPDLLEDLPGRDPQARYNAVVVFTRHGAVHVPQAKIAPQSFETNAALDGPGIGVAPYGRLNRVTLDLDDDLVEARFVVSSDLMALQRWTPAALRCDLLVVLGHFPHGAEEKASRLLGRALAAGAAGTALQVNGFDVPARPRRQPLALAVEEVLDATRAARPRARWPSPRAIRAAFHVYDDRAARNFPSLCRLPRRGRIPVPRSRWAAPLALGQYPVTIVL
jgi:hypothetical protein